MIDSSLFRFNKIRDWLYNKLFFIPFTSTLTHVSFFAPLCRTMAAAGAAPAAPIAPAAPAAPAPAEIPAGDLPPLQEVLVKTPEEWQALCESKSVQPLRTLGLLTKHNGQDLAQVLSSRKVLVLGLSVDSAVRPPIFTTSGNATVVSEDETEVTALDITLTGQWDILFANFGGLLTSFRRLSSLTFSIKAQERGDGASLMNMLAAALSSARGPVLERLSFTLCPLTPRFSEAFLASLTRQRATMRSLTMGIHKESTDADIAKVVRGLKFLPL
jgi:hypothetical protein